MVQQMPDAPWIRDAENNGMPFDDKPKCCPICGEEWPEYIYRQGADVIGCSECVERISVDDWDDNDE